MFNDHDDDDDDDWNIWQKHDISDVWWAPTQPAMWPWWGVHLGWSRFSSISGWKPFLFIFASFYCENSVFLIFSKTITLMQSRLRWIMNNQNGCLLSPRFETGQWTVSIGHPHYAMCTCLYSVAKTSWYDFPCQNWMMRCYLIGRLWKDQDSKRSLATTVERLPKGEKNIVTYMMIWWMGWFVTQERQLCFRVIFQQINKTFRSINPSRCHNLHPTLEILIRYTPASVNICFLLWKL